MAEEQKTLEIKPETKLEKTEIKEEASKKECKPETIKEKKEKKLLTKEEKEIRENKKIEANNLLEDLPELVEKCIKCGMCKSICPVFLSCREELKSPRGKMILLSEKIVHKLMYECSLCKACEKKCPLNLKICDAIRKAREVLTLTDRELPENKEMIEHIRKFGKPFQDFHDAKCNKLYCC